MILGCLSSGLAECTIDRTQRKAKQIILIVFFYHSTMNNKSSNGTALKENKAVIRLYRLWRPPTIQFFLLIMDVGTYHLPTGLSVKFHSLKNLIRAITEQKSTKPSTNTISKSISLLSAELKSNKHLYLQLPKYILSFRSGTYEFLSLGGLPILDNHNKFAIYF